MWRVGRSNTVEILADKNLIIKTAHSASSKHPLHLRLEMSVLEITRSAGVNVPKVLDYYLNNNNQEVLVMEKIDGIALNDNFPLQKQITAMIDAGGQMKKMIGRGTGYGWIQLPQLKGVYGSWKEFLKFYCNYYGSRLVTAEIIKPELLLQISGLLDNPSLDQCSSDLIHRDLKPSNLIIDASNRIWIVDWENAIFGDGLYETAVLGVSRGHGVLWQKFAEISDAREQQSDKYKVYEIAALLGLIDFLRKCRHDFFAEMITLHNLLQNNRGK